MSGLAICPNVPNKEKVKGREELSYCIPGTLRGRRGKYAFKFIFLTQTLALDLNKGGRIGNRGEVCIIFKQFQTQVCFLVVSSGSHRWSLSQGWSGGVLVTIRKPLLPGSGLSCEALLFLSSGRAAHCKDVIH
jgi:hypothetical protein